MNGKKYKVFVYGSLLKGLGNHRVIDQPGVKFLCKDSIRAKLFTSHWSWPFIVFSQSNKDRVYGETYEVPRNVFQRLDQLEGYSPNDSSSLFFRKYAFTKEKHRVHIYEGGTHLRNARQRFWLTKGDWFKSFNTYHKGENMQANRIAMESSKEIILIQ